MFIEYQNKTVEGDLSLVWLNRNYKCNRTGLNKLRYHILKDDS